MSGKVFKYIGQTKKARAGGLLFEQNKPVIVDNAALARRLSENKSFEEVQSPKVNVVARHPDPQLEPEKKKARSPKDDAERS